MNYQFERFKLIGMSPLINSLKLKGNNGKTYYFRPLYVSVKDFTIGKFYRLVEDRLIEVQV